MRYLVHYKRTEDGALTGSPSHDVLYDALKTFKGFIEDGFYRVDIFSIEDDTFNIIKEYDVGDIEVEVGSIVENLELI